MVKTVVTQTTDEWIGTYDAKKVALQVALALKTHSDSDTLLDSTKSIYSWLIATEET